MKKKESEFQYIYSSTFDELSKFVYFRVKTLEDAQDIVQSVYLDYYQYVFLKRKKIENLIGYLKQMAHHRLSSYYKDTHWLVDSNELTSELINSIEDMIKVEETFFDQFESDQLWNAVKKLKPIQEKIIIAKYRFDMTFREISESLAINENSIKTMYYRGLRELERILTDNRFK